MQEVEVGVVVGEGKFGLCECHPYISKNVNTLEIIHCDYKILATLFSLLFLLFHNPLAIVGSLFVDLYIIQQALIITTVSSYWGACESGELLHM